MSSNRRVPVPNGTGTMCIWLVDEPGDDERASQGCAADDHDVSLTGGLLGLPQGGLDAVPHEGVYGDLLARPTSS